MSQVPPHLAPFRQALDFSLDRLITTLTQAQTYLGEGNDNACVGTLVGIMDEEYANLQAALRLFLNNRRRGI